MVDLNKRFSRLRVGTTLVEGLRFAFTVKKTSKPEPNEAEIKIWNLNAFNRGALEAQQLFPVSLEAGYENFHGEIFLGNLKSVWTEYDGLNWITTITSADGGAAYQKVRVNKAYAKGTPIATVVTDLAASMAPASVGPGNLAAVAATVASKTALTQTLPRATVVSGRASQELTELLRASGIEWSIQDLGLQLIQEGQVLPGHAVQLTPNNGLIGSPSIDSKGVMSCQSLLIPDLKPGKLLLVKSKVLTGQFRIETVQYEGDTGSDSWHVAIEGKAY